MEASQTKSKKKGNHLGGIFDNVDDGKRNNGLTSERIAEESKDYQRRFC